MHASKPSTASLIGLCIERFQDRTHGHDDPWGNSLRGQSPTSATGNAATKQHHNPQDPHTAARPKSGTQLPRSPSLTDFRPVSTAPSYLIPSESFPLGIRKSVPLFSKYPTRLISFNLLN